MPSTCHSINPLPPESMSLLLLSRLVSDTQRAGLLQLSISTLDRSPRRRHHLQNSTQSLARHGTVAPDRQRNRSDRFPSPAHAATAQRESPGGPTTEDQRPSAGPAANGRPTKLTSTTAQRAGHSTRSYESLSIRVCSITEIQAESHHKASIQE